MALSRDKKVAIIKDISQLLADSKLTVVVKYRGTNVRQLQELRAQARDSQSLVRVVKNRLVIQALKASDKLATVPTEALNDMLIYVFNASDEIAGAQLVSSFAKQTGASLEFVGAISPDGQFVSAAEVQQLANLLPKDQQLAALVQLLSSPFSNLIQTIGQPLPTVIQNLKARVA